MTVEELLAKAAKEVMQEQLATASTEEDSVEEEVEVQQADTEALQSTSKSGC